MGILAPLCALATAVWAIILIRWGSVITFGVVVLLAGTIFGPDFYHYDGPFQVSSERILWAGLMGLFAIHLRLGKLDWKRFTATDWVLIAFALVTGISSRFGVPVTDGSNPLARWLFYVAMPTGLYIAIKQSNIRLQDVRLVLNFLIGIGIYLAITAIFEARGLHGLVFPRYIVDPSIWEFYGRGRGALLNPSGIGILMTAALGATTMRWFDTNRFGKLAYAAASLILLAGCYSTLTRCVWLGAFVTVALIVYIHASKLMRIWAISASIIMVLGLGSIVVQSVLEFKRDKAMSAEAAKQSVELRPLLAILALEMFQDRPLTGHGFGHYVDAHKKYVENPHWGVPLANALNYHQHNVFLSILVDCGLIGASLYAALIFSWVRISYRVFENKILDRDVRIFGIASLSMLIGYLANGMFQDVTIVHMVNMYMCFFAALCSGLYVRGGLGHLTSIRERVQLRRSGSFLRT